MAEREEIKKLIVHYRTLDIETGRMECDGCPNPGLTTSVTEVYTHVIPETSPEASVEVQIAEA